MADPKDKLLLDAAYEWEKNSPNRVYMTQPLGDGKVVDYTWAETMNEARRMAAHLRSLDLPEHSHIALISKNCAHFVMCDLAIWMAGHATIALYPTLNADTVEYILDHSDSRLVFIGKLDDWDDLKLGIPDSLPKIALPLAPKTDFDKWDDIIARNEPITDSPSPPGEQLALMCYTSGSTGRPKGVMHSFASASIPAQGFGRELEITTDDRILSYLPLAHVMERATVECASFYTGTHIYFADSLNTFLQDLHRARPTLFISVPRLWLNQIPARCLPEISREKTGSPAENPADWPYCAQKNRGGPGPGRCAYSRQRIGPSSSRPDRMVRQAWPAHYRGLRHERGFRLLPHVHSPKAQTGLCRCGLERCTDQGQ